MFAPVLVTIVLAGHLFNAGPRAAVPLLSDEVAYWNQIAAFSRAGMHGGYHTINEQPSRSGFSRFGPHGPAFAIIYGTIGRFLGWRPYSGSLISMVLVTIAAAWWCAASRCGWWSVLALATFWPLILFLPSTMQEPLHFAIAMIVAAGLAPRLAQPSGRGGLAVVIVCLLAGFIRPTWAFVAVPAAWAMTRGLSRSAQVVTIGATAAAAVGVGAVFGWLAAPYPGAIFSLSEANPASLLSQAIARAAMNAYAFVVPVEADPMEVLVRYEMLAVLIGAAIAVWRMPRQHAGREIFIVMMVSLTVAAVIVGGSVERWRDFRVMAPVLLLALLIWLPGGAIASRLIVIANLVALPFAVASFERMHEPRFAPQSKTDYFARAIAGVVAFQPGAGGWQNTVLMHVDTVDPALVALPHGVALSVAFAWEDVVLPPRSRYLLLRAGDVDEVSARVPMRLLATTPIGRLYDNLAMVQSPR